MRWFADLARLRREHKADGTVVTEAGGCYSTLDGSPRPGSGVSVYAADGSLRDRALTLMRGGPR